MLQVETLGGSPCTVWMAARGTMNSLLDTTVNRCTGQYAGILLFARLWRPDWVSCCACAAAGGGTPAGEDI